MKSEEEIREELEERREKPGLYKYEIHMLEWVLEEDSK